MIILGYLVYLLIDWFILMRIFTFSTYHRFALWALPAVAVYGYASSTIAAKIGLSNFLYWHIVVMGIVLFLIGRIQVVSIRNIQTMTVNDNELNNFVAKSGKTTVLMYAASACIYIASYSASAFFTNDFLGKPS